MKELTIEEIKMCALETLVDVAAFCKEHNITYYLCGGTLLGAVRHKGYIPWDDDIDICMPRPDYERFLASYTSENHTLFHYKKQADYYYPFAKVANNKTCLFETRVKSIDGMGVYVDIFPMDGLSDSKKTAQKILRSNCFKRDLQAVGVSTTGKGIKGVVKSIIKAFSPKNAAWKLCDKIEKKTKKFPFEKSRFVGCTFGVYGKREVMPREVFSEVTPLSFEGHLLNAPVGYDFYLSSLYGDYMTPPPEDKRHSTHSYKAYWREEQ